MNIEMNIEEKKLIEVYKKDKEYFLSFIDDSELFMNGIYTVNLLKDMYKMGIIKLNKNKYFLHRCMKEDKEYMKYVYPYSYIYDKKKMKSGISKNFYDKIAYCDEIDEEIINNSEISKWSEVSIRIIIRNKKVREEVKEIFFEENKLNMEYMVEFKEGSKFDYEYCRSKGIEYLEMYMRVSKEIKDEIKERVYRDIYERNEYIYSIIKNEYMKVKDIIDIVDRYIREGCKRYKNMYEMMMYYCISNRRDITVEEINRYDEMFRRIDKMNNIERGNIDKNINRYLLNKERDVEKFMKYVKNMNKTNYVNNYDIDYKEIFYREEYMREIKKYRNVYYDMYKSDSITREFVYSIRDKIKEEKDENIYYKLSNNYNIGEEYVKKVFGYENKKRYKEGYKYGLVKEESKKYRKIYDICMNRIEEMYIKHVYKNRINEEMIRKSCRPERVYNWNEYMMEEYKDEYNKECDKYKKL